MRIYRQIRVCLQCFLENIGYRTHDEATQLMHIMDKRKPPRLDPDTRYFSLWHIGDDGDGHGSRCLHLCARLHGVMRRGIYAGDVRHQCIKIQAHRMHVDASMLGDIDDIAMLQRRKLLLRTNAVGGIFLKGFMRVDRDAFLHPQEFYPLLRRIRETVRRSAKYEIAGSERLHHLRRLGIGIEKEDASVWSVDSRAIVRMMRSSRQRKTAKCDRIHRRLVLVSGFDDSVFQAIGKTEFFEASTNGVDDILIGVHHRKIEMHEHGDDPIQCLGTAVRQKPRTNMLSHRDQDTDIGHDDLRPRKLRRA